jgi:branched-subunit amino acid transport protein AzlD
MSMFFSLDTTINGEVFRSIEKYLKKMKETGQSTEPEMVHDLLDKSHTGLFLGTVCLTGGLVALIMVQILLSTSHDHPDAKDEAAIIFYSTNLVLYILAVVAVLVGKFKLRHLPFSFLRQNNLDVTLLMLSLCGLLIYSMFKLICVFSLIKSEATASLIVEGLSGLFNIIESLLQTIFIVTGLYKYSDTKEDREKKPARGIITFLIVVNLSIWLLKSFGEQDTTNDLMEEFYGTIPWLMIFHITLPLMLFYRFHSSVCLADMWMSTYVNEHSPLQYIEL